MKLVQISCLCLAALLAACQDDKEEYLPNVKPETSGTFVDSRDQYEYHWVRFDGLDWTVENAHYDTGEGSCFIYPEIHGSSVTYSEANLPKYGYLYTFEGAQKAVPEGWRLPTDEDWNRLEAALGSSSDKLQQYGWRGAAGLAMQQDEADSGLNLLMGGYYNTYFDANGDGANYRHIGSFGYFWSQTKDTSKEGEYYFYRKVMYDRPQVYRESINIQNYYLSVRFVRDAQ